MSEAANVQMVHDLFAAFGRGDLDSVMGMLAEDVDWWNFGPAELGYTGVRRGKQQVRQFFEQIDSAFDHQAVVPREFIAQGDQVAVTGDERVLVKANGVTVENPWCMIFTFRDGKIARWRCY